MDLHKNTGTGSDTLPPDAQAMTREELEYLLEMAEINAERFAHPILAHDAAQRLTMEQQAGEIERLKEKWGERRANLIEYYEQQLAAMTAERDAAVTRYEQLAYGYGMNPVDPMATLNVALAQQVQELQARLTASEQEAGLLKELLAISKCGVCTGCGWYEDTDRLTGEPIQVQCRYCCEAQRALTGEGGGMIAT